MMKKTLISTLSILLVLMLALPACAQPLVSGAEGYTACLGADNFLYLTDPQGVTKVLQTPIATLMGMDGEYLYCTTPDGAMYEVRLDGTASRVIAQAPALVAPYTLEEGVLVPNNADGTALSGIPGVAVACATPTALYYAVATVSNGYNLMCLDLPIQGNTLPAPRLLFQFQHKPVSITASPDAVALVTDNQAVTLHIPDSVGQGLTQHGVALSQSGVTHVYLYNGKLVSLACSEDGQYTVVDSVEYTLAAPAVMLTPVPSPVVTATPAPTTKPTARPTATPRPAEPEDDGRVSMGDVNYSVKKMQRRLDELGYPVGKIDGAFGENTLLAVNLFQCAIGYRNRSYASSRMLEKLYAKNAPVYDPYAPLKEGDEGAHVKIMQTVLHDLGYDVGEKGLDGKFGKDTRAAVEQFQFVAGLEVTGEADPETLRKLLDPENPIPNVPQGSDCTTPTDL